MRRRTLLAAIHKPSALVILAAYVLLNLGYALRTGGMTRSLSAPPFGKCGGDEPLTAEEEGGDRGGRVLKFLPLPIR
jgi:hypothetical protein